MRIGIIGPTNVQQTSLAAGKDPAAWKGTAREAGEGLAARSYDPVAVPDRGAALMAAGAYNGAGNRRLIGIFPDGHTSGQAATGLCDEIISDLDWTEQHERICQLSAVLLCIGLSCGTMSEIACVESVGKTPVIVIRPLTGGIPPELEAETDLRRVEKLEGACQPLAEMARSNER